MEQNKERQCEEAMGTVNLRQECFMPIFVATILRTYKCFAITATVLKVLMENVPIKFSRFWNMPCGDTFTVPVIGNFVRRFLQTSEVSVDPFARNKRWATHTNDLNPATEAEHHMEARVFLAMLVERGVRADLLIFDPPYSPRQISECYAMAGMKAGMADTQNAKLVKECRDLMRQIAQPGAVCLSFGWNTNGMGKQRGYEPIEIMIVDHGGSHNSTLCLAEKRLPEEKELDFMNDRPGWLMSQGTAREVEMCGKTLRIGDYVKVRYTKGTWSKGGTLQGVITELWSPKLDNHLQARVDDTWCFHDYDEILTHNAEGQGCRASRHTLDPLVGASGAPNPGRKKR